MNLITNRGDLWAFSLIFLSTKGFAPVEIWQPENQKAMLAESMKRLGREVKWQLKSAAIPAFLLTLTGIFAWQATQGEHGLIMRERRKVELAQAEANLTAARAERDNWERKVAGLTAAHLDRDALDQRARELLNLADPGEVVVQYGPKDKVF